MATILIAGKHHFHALAMHSTENSPEDQPQEDLQVEVKTVDGNAVVVGVAVGILIGVVGWFLIPYLRALLSPDAPGGNNGPWVFRAGLMWRMVTAALLTCLSTPLILQTLNAKWNIERLTAGRVAWVPILARVATSDLRVVVLSLFLFTAVAFYVRAWTLVAQDAITEQSPWKSKRRLYSEITALDFIPAGEHSESLKERGPWYRIAFRDGRTLPLETDPHGANVVDQTNAAAFISDRAGMAWTDRSERASRDAH